MKNINFGDLGFDLAAFEVRVGKAMTALDKLGVAEGGAVILLLRNDLAFLEAIVAVGRLGASPVPVNWHGKAEEVRAVVEDSGAKFVVAHDDLAASASIAWNDSLTLILVPASGDVINDIPFTTLQWGALLDASEVYQGPRKKQRGAMIYTSGTTSAPKAIDRDAMTPAQAALMAESLRLTYGFRKGMRAMIAGPLYHSMSVSYAATALATMGEEGALFIEPRFDERRFLQMVSEHRITHLLMVPVMFVRLLRLTQEERAQYDLTCIEAVTHSAAPCPADIKAAIINWWGPVLREFYGASETGPVTLCTSEDSALKPGTVGKTLPGCEVQVLDDDGRPVAVGVSGEIAIKNSSYPPFTYRHRPEERAKLDRNGLVAPGDIGFLDEDGYLFLRDRKKDMVITGGVNVFPAEIEGVLLGMPQIKDVAVFGIPDAEYGESLGAHVELWESTKLADEEIRSFLKQKLPGYKIPKIIEFCILPRDDNGKIAKRKISDVYWAHTGRRI